MSKGLNFLTTVVAILPPEDVTSLTTPSVADWATSVPLDQFMLATSQLPAHGADKTVTEMGIDESVDVAAITGSSSDGWHLDMFFDYNPSTLLPSTTDFRTVFTDPNMPWVLLVRTGLPFDTALAIGQKVDLYQVASGATQKNRSFEGYHKGTIQLHNMGPMYEDRTLVA